MTPPVQPDPINPIAFVICGAIAGLWAFNDFHQPFSRADIRNSSSVGRYALGVTVYVAGAILLYMVLTQVMLVIAPRIWDMLGIPREGNVSIGEETQSTGFASSSFAVLLLVSTPLLPAVSRWLAATRQAAQCLAYFPNGIDRLVTILGNVGTAFHPKAIDRISRELRRYGVEDSELRFPRRLSRALASALEIQSIYLRLEEAGANDGQNRSALKLIRKQTEAIYLNYCRFLRHLADAFIVSRQLQDEDKCDDALTALSEFVEDEGNAVLVKFRRAVAQGTLSRVVGLRSRVTFLGTMGYEVRPELALPFWPVALTFAAVLLGNAIYPVTQLILKTSTNSSFSLSDRAGRVNVLMVLATQAASFCAAVLWAVAPKRDFPSARPSLRSLPVNAYILLALCAYATSVFLYQSMYFAHPSLPFARAGFRAAPILALMAPVLTLLLSLEVDLHLMGRQPPGWRGRIVDGGLLAAGMLAAQFAVFRFLVGPFVIPHVQKLPPPNPSQFLWYGLASALIWFLIGFAVPVTAAASLQRILLSYRMLPEISKAFGSAGARGAVAGAGT